MSKCLLYTRWPLSAPAALLHRPLLLVRYDIDWSINSVKLFKVFHLIVFQPNELYEFTIVKCFAPLNLKQSLARLFRTQQTPFNATDKQKGKEVKKSPHVSLTY